MIQTILGFSPADFGDEVQPAMQKMLRRMIVICFIAESFSYSNL
jgi:hypothetical protein